MVKLPNLEKNAYLSIYIKDGCIRANLIYSDFNISRYYILTDFLERVEHKDLLSPKFWFEYFSSLEEVFSWDIVHKSENRFIFFGGEGVGIVGVDVVIDGRYQKQTVDVISSLREFNSDININVVDTSYVESVMAGISLKEQYTDLVYLDLSLKHTYIYRYIKEGNRSILVSSPNTKSNFSTGKVVWESDRGLINSVVESKFDAFLTTETPKSTMINDWANYVVNYGRYKVNNRIEDMLRSFLTATLLNIRNDNEGKFDGIGRNGKTGIIVGGDMIHSMPINPIVVAMIDGLELIDEIDLLVDEKENTFDIGKTYTAGNIGSKYVVNIKDIYSRIIKLLVPDIGRGIKDRKVIFDSMVQGENVSNKLFAMSGEISHLQLPKVPYMINGKFVNGCKLSKTGEYELLDKNNMFEAVILDGRVRPIVYGPSPKDNRLKLHQWLNEESTTINN